MNPINSSDVRLLRTTEDLSSHPPKFLEYLSNLYELITTFSTSQKAQACALWTELTDYSSTVCLLVREIDGYSVWGLSNRSITEIEISSPEDSNHGNTLFSDISCWLSRSLWLIIADLAGGDRAQAFGQDVIDSSLPINSWGQLRSAISVGQPILISQDHPVDAMAGSIDTLQQLTAKYIGPCYAKQVIRDLTAQLSCPATMEEVLP